MKKVPSKRHCLEETIDNLFEVIKDKDKLIVALANSVKSLELEIIALEKEVILAKRREEYLMQDLKAQVAIISAYAQGDDGAMKLAEFNARKCEENILSRLWALPTKEGETK